MHKTVTLLLFTSLLLLSCNSNKGRVLSKKEMEDVLYEIQLVHAVTNEFSLKLTSPEQKDSLVNDVLYKYDITQADLDASLVWYADNMDEYKKINDQIVARLKAKRNELASQLTGRGVDTKYNIMPEYMNLECDVPIFSFDIDSLRLKSIDIPSFSWNFSTLGVSPNDSLVASSIFIYKDTLVQEVQHILNDNLYTFNKPELPDSLLQSISGYVRICNNNENAGLLLYKMNYINSTTAPSAKE